MDSKAPEEVYFLRGTACRSTRHCSFLQERQDAHTTALPPQQYCTYDKYSNTVGFFEHARLSSRFRPALPSHTPYLDEGSPPLPLHREVRAGLLRRGDPDHPEDGDARFAQTHVHRELAVALDKLLFARVTISDGKG